MKIVEKMARIIDPDCWANPQEFPFTVRQSVSMRRAVACLRAIREPSEEMIDASRREDIGLEEEVYTAMIDAAIAEAETP